MGTPKKKKKPAGGAKGKKAPAKKSIVKKPPVSNATKAAKKETAPKKPESPWTLAEVRRQWISYFKEKGHTHVPSASLLPAGDPTLLFNTAGMVPFKGYFAGSQEAPFKRAISIQKCLRTTDLESVGKTARHCTFFEMLGNFSFGDYFKKEAIRFAYEFSVDRLRLDPAKIWVTVYTEDDEAEELWVKETGIPRERIRRLGKTDNWWGPAGDSGACGPCSELYLDRGPERCTCVDKAACGPGSSCDRYMEYWNLVFNQYHQDTAGKLHPLPKTGIDTGAGLERIAALLNGLDSVYDTDEMHRVIRLIEELVPQLRSDGKHVHYGEAVAAPFRVLTDHARAASFAIGDGIVPDNTGRGYVIRRVIRRGLLFARELGIQEPILHRLVPLIVDIYGPFYPEIKQKKAEIEKRILQEEERFLHTLEIGLRRWEEYLGEHVRAKKTTFDGAHAFRLYDTFGFPLEMTVELAERAGLTVDTEAFNSHMENQRQAASQASRWKDWTLPADFPLDGTHKSQFVGYDQRTETGRILALVSGDSSPKQLSQPGTCVVVLDRTPFYPEGGGQIGDTGRITTENGAVVRVSDTRKKGDVILHFGELIAGTIKIADAATATVDSERRDDLMRHHSATHLLNAALRSVLGDHVVQTGSLVAPEYLRFDFSHHEKLGEEAVAEVELKVNKAILQKADVEAVVQPIETARKSGAVATFGEKYGTEVRVVSMGSGGGLSREFCGGCHVSNTGDIQIFHIVRESSPGAGNRRIEAVAGSHVLAHFEAEFAALATSVAEHNAKAKLFSEKTGADDFTIPEEPWDSAALRAALAKGASAPLEVAEKIAQIQALLKEKARLMQTAEREAVKAKAGSLPTARELIDAATVAGSVKIVSTKFEDQDVDALRKLGDSIKETERSVVILFANNGAKGPVLLFMANKGAVSAGADCGKLIKSVSARIGGGGGGRPDMAQAGGKNAAGLDEALAAAKAELVAALGA